MACNPFTSKEHKGYKIGIMAFMDEQSLDTVKPDINCSLLQYLDYHRELEKYSKILKEEHKCELLISLNHMRTPNDRKMTSSHD